LDFSLWRLLILYHFKLSGIDKEVQLSATEAAKKVKEMAE